MLVKLGTNTYRIVFAPSHTIAQGEALGTCDHPDVDKEFPEIVISEDLDGQQLLDTLIHEGLHAMSIGVLDEHFVGTTATAIAKLLWKMNWRPHAKTTEYRGKDRRAKPGSRSRRRRGR